jgi:hypothetical protein
LFKNSRVSQERVRNAYKILVGRPEGKKRLEGLRRRWEDNIEMDVRDNKMGWYGL